MKNNHQTTSTRRMAIQKGAGLGFAAAAFVFFSTGSLLSLLLVPAGVALGLGIDTTLARSPKLARRVTNLTARGGSIGKAAIHRLEDDRLLVRFGLLLVLATVVFVATWFVSYYLLPEGLLHRGSSVRMMGNEDVATDLWSELRFIIVRNLPWVFVIALLNWLLGYPFAALVPLCWVVLYAVFLGTNSFSVPMPERMAPSLDVFSRAGPYEMAAFLFATASTFSLSRVSLPWRRTEAKVSVPWHTVIIGLALGGVGIVLAAWREAAMLIGGR